MPTFTYTSRDGKGAMQAGNLEAVNEDQVLAILQNRGLLVTAISQKTLEGAAFKPAASRAARARRMHSGVTTSDQVLLCQQLATLVDAGIPLLKSLQVASAQVESRSLLIVLEEVHRDVEAGSTLGKALAKHPAIFSNLWLNLVETGETSGHLAQAFAQLARHFEAVQHLKNETQTALTYPAFLVVAAVLVLALFVYWLIPKFATMFASLDIEMPLLTRIVLGVSEAARRYVVAIIGSAVLAFWSLRRYLRTDAGQWMRDRLLLHLPLFKSLFTYVQLAEFSRGLATLLESGVPLLSCLDILANSSTNKVYGQAIGTIKEAVKEGKTMYEPMDKTGLFPPMTVQMIQVGEEVGELGKMTSRIARYYEEQVETFIARMTRLFEPIAIVVMGGLVLIIVLSIFLPIFKMAGGMHG